MKSKKGYIYYESHSKKEKNLLQRIWDWRFIETKGEWIKCPICNYKK